MATTPFSGTSLVTGANPVGLLEFWQKPPSQSSSFLYAIYDDELVLAYSNPVYTAAMVVLEDTGWQPIIPGLTFDENLEHFTDYRQQQDDEPWHTFFTIPVAPPTLGWDDWDWNKNFDKRWSAAEEDFGALPIIPAQFWEDDLSHFTDTRMSVDDEPWHTFFSIPQPPPNLGWDDWDWSHGISGFTFGAMYPEEEFGSWVLPPPPPGPSAVGRSARFGFSFSAFR